MPEVRLYSASSQFHASSCITELTPASRLPMGATFASKMPFDFSVLMILESVLYATADCTSGFHSPNSGSHWNHAQHWRFL